MSGNQSLLFTSAGDEIFKFEDDVEIRFGKAKSGDFYKLLNIKTNEGSHTEATRWSKSLSLNEGAWSNIFKSVKNVCKESKLSEFYFKFLHRITVNSF